MIPLPVIMIGSWLLGTIIVYVLTPLFPWGIVYSDARDLENDYESPKIFFFSSLWPVLIGLGLPILGIYCLREWVKEARLKRLPANVRVELDDEDDDWDDEEDEDDLDDDEEEIERELDYRTASCHSCGHAVMKEP